MSRLPQSIIDQRLVAAFFPFSPVSGRVRRVDGDQPGRNEKIADDEFAVAPAVGIMSEQFAGILLIARDRCPFSAIADEVREVVRQRDRLGFRVIVGQKDDVDFGKLQAFAESEAEGQGDRDGTGGGRGDAGENGERRAAGEKGEEFDAGSGPHLRPFKFKETEFPDGAVVGAHGFRAVRRGFRRVADVVQVADGNAVDHQLVRRFFFFEIRFLMADDAALHQDEAGCQPQ